jgi:hypothetical protein
MAQGGARSRSGPQPKEGSGRSDRRGYVLTALPAEGYEGPIPEFPLPFPEDREIEIWNWLWRTPQACAWSLPSEEWRTPIVAMYTRQFWKAESLGSAPAVVAQLHRLGDQIGMTTAGLAEMGWKVAVDELAEKAATPTAEPAAPRARRLRSADAQ